MPLSSEIDWPARTVRMTLQDVVTMDEITDVVGAVFAKVGDTPFRVLSDHRGLAKPATAALLESFVAFLRTHGKAVHGQRFAVVTATPASYGMMRMLSVLAERVPMEVGIFQTVEEAEAWLGPAPSTD